MHKDPPQGLALISMTCILFCLVPGAGTDKERKIVMTFGLMLSFFRNQKNGTVFFQRETVFGIFHYFLRSQWTPKLGFLLYDFTFEMRAWH